MSDRRLPTPARDQAATPEPGEETPLPHRTRLGQTAIQRKIVQRWRARQGERGGPAQASAAAPDAEPAAAPPASAPGGGGGLDGAVQHKMEHAFGADFSSVRIHQGDQATALGAHAYTQGEDVHFAPGQYDPSSSAGQALIGHELTHVVQQRAGLVDTPQGKGGAINADPALEAEADTLGERAARGETVTVTNAGAGTQRKAAAGQAIQRKGEYERLRGDDPGRAAALQAEADQRYQQAVADFDRNVGRALAEHPLSHRGADALLTRMRALVETYAGVISDDEERRHEIMADTFGVRDKKVIRSPGATRRSYDAVMGVLDHLDGANLRQKMSMVYVAITDGGLAKALDRMRSDLQAEAAHGVPPGAAPSPFGGLGMDTDYLLGADMDDRYAKLEPGHGATRALFARSEVVSGDNNDRTGKADMTAEEKKEQRGKSLANRMTPDELAADKSRLPLSLGELESLYPAKATEVREQLAAGGGEPAPEQVREALMAEVGGKKLKWSPGEAVYKIRDDSNLKRKADQLKVMLRAGLSGSTDMYLHAARHFKLTAPADLEPIRCAALGSMIPEHDHSFYEIMMASTAYGLDYQPGPGGYGAFKPFSAEQVRKLAGLEHLPAYYLDEYLDERASGSGAEHERGPGVDPVVASPDAALPGPGPLPDLGGPAAAINLFFDPAANHYSYLVPPGPAGGPYIEMTVAGDGACLFHACAKALEAELSRAHGNADQGTVRGIVARELRKDVYRARVGTAIADLATILRAGREPAGVSTVFLQKLRPLMQRVNAELDLANAKGATHIGAIELGHYAGTMYEALVDDYVTAVQINRNMWGGQLEIEALGNATGHQIDVVKPDRGGDRYDRTSIVPGSEDRTTAALGADAVLRADDPEHDARLAARQDGTEVSPPSAPPGLQPSDPDAAVGNDDALEAEPFAEAPPRPPGHDEARPGKAKKKSAAERTLDAFDSSTLGIDYGPREAWEGTTTDPNKHDPDAFRYFVHGAKATKRILDPSRLDNTFLSTSLVDQDHLGVYFPSGMILDVPPQCILVAGGADLGVSNKAVKDKKRLGADVANAAERADTGSKDERHQEVRRQLRQEQYDRELADYNDRKAAWDKAQQKRLAFLRKKPPKPGAQPVAPDPNARVEPSSMEEQKAFNAAYRESIAATKVPVKLLGPDEVLARAKGNSHTEVSVLGHTADGAHRVRTIGFFVVVFSDEEAAAVNAGKQPSTISAKHWQAIQTSAGKHKLPIVALKYDRVTHGEMECVGDAEFQKQTNPAADE